MREVFSVPAKLWCVFVCPAARMAGTRDSCETAQYRCKSSSVKPLPLYVLITMEYLRRKIRQRRHCECGLVRSSWKEAWRVDAPADDGGLEAGGLEPTRRSRSGRKSLRGSRLPHAREGKAHRATATLEGSTGVPSGPLGVQSRRQSSKSPPSHNKVNGHVINKLTTTRFPLCATRDGAGSASGVQGVRMDAERPEPGGGRPVEFLDQRLRSFERGDGGYGGSELAGTAPGA